ncbi:hypothetical protein MPH_02935 [Macrophomina phaseolina MS6]|uniref:Uncharacterized protein n=1 Tax=Macrophomina phaseolina (strain MS6) TaxID=1126212 RepID=K2SBL1_MACPH|nr:hypothetical protein MPH_02935 [Macrophomina phaseolina MS6]
MLTNLAAPLDLPTPPLQRENMRGDCLMPERPMGEGPSPSPSRSAQSPRSRRSDSISQSFDRWVQHVERDSVKTTISEGPREILRSAAAQFVRPDLLPFLAHNLPLWTQHGLWRNTDAALPVSNLEPLERLIKAYSCVCQLQDRIGDDPIRERVAFVWLHLEFEAAYAQWRRRNGISCDDDSNAGRRNASDVVSSVLTATYPGFHDARPEEKAQRRRRFHSSKRLGKRWHILVRGLGYGVLFVCSESVVAVVYVWASRTTIS